MDKVKGRNRKSSLRKGEGDPKEGVSSVNVIAPEVSSKKVKRVGAGGRVRDRGPGQATGSSHGMRTRSAAGAERSGRSGNRDSSPEEKSSGEEPGEEAHPCLFVENVLDVVFKHLINQPGRRKYISHAVQNVRLVSKSWSTSITRLYRQTRPETVFPRYVGGHRPLTSLTQFMKTMNSSQMIPVQRFQFSSRVFHHDNLEMLREFLVLCGPDAVSLELSMDSIDSERIMANLENLADFQMMKLKTLGLHIWEARHKQVNMEAGQVHGNVKFLELLLTAGRTLRELELSYPPCSPPSYRPQQGIIIQQLTAAIANGLPRTVKQLRLSLDMKESGFNALAGIQSKLERFELNVCFALGGRTLYQFLQSQAATLRELRIHSTSGLGRGDGILVEFPRLEALAHLDLFDATVRTTAPSNFAQTFPSLECLKITSMDLKTNFRALLSIMKGPSRSLEVLHLPICWRFAGPAALVKDVAQSFPCLTELHLLLPDVTEELMGEVFAHFDSLELLHIIFKCMDGMKNPTWAESLFSGISESDCIRIKRLEDFGNEDLNQLPRRPSLLNLTRLRKLAIDISDPCRWLRFTDFSAHFIFLKMDTLVEIRLPNYVVEFSPMYSELLKDKLVLRG